MYDSKSRIDKARKKTASVQFAVQKKLMRKYNPDLQDIYTKGTAKQTPNASVDKEDK